MGATIWVEIHGQSNDTATDNSIMHRLMDNLDALADKLHVTKLSDFYDYSTLEDAYDFDEDEDSDEEADEDESVPEPTLEQRQAVGDWFDSPDGLKSLRALRKHLAQQFDDLAFTPSGSQTHWPKDLMEELAGSEARLDEAIAKGQRFRLLIVP